MAFQTGTFANINDVLRGFATFLTANGWTIHELWRQPLLLNRISDIRNAGQPDEYVVMHFRWAVKLTASKGNKHVQFQDFFQHDDIAFGTHQGTFPINGPGIVGGIGTGHNVPVDPYDEAYVSSVSPALYTPWHYASDGVTPVYVQGGGVVQFASPLDHLVNPCPAVVCPLPQVVGQENGTQATSDQFFVNGYPNNDTELYAPFGPPGGSVFTGPFTPMKYWFMCDGTGDNVIMVCLHDGLTGTSKTTYLCFGDLTKIGAWAGSGVYMGGTGGVALNGTVTGQSGAFTGLDVVGHDPKRFGPPGAVADDQSRSFHVRAGPIDSSAETWVSVGGGARRVYPSTQMRTTQGTGPLGVKSTNFATGNLMSRQSTLNSGAPLLPTWFEITRDITDGIQMYSLFGILPNIYQAETTGFAPGEEYVAKDGTTYVIFDGFAVKKVP